MKFYFALPYKYANFSYKQNNRYQLDKEDRYVKKIQTTAAGTFDGNLSFFHYEFSSHGWIGPFSTLIS
jgi:hypothetical protein